MNHPRMARAGRVLYWGLFALALAVAAFYLAWLGLAAVDFAYPLWHDALGIDRTIEQYGPQNRYRDGFEQTSPAERARLFGAIVDAIHADGHGLAGLEYRDPDGRTLGRLLRPPEIVHLRDVAALVDGFLLAGRGALALAVALAALAWWRAWRLPPLRYFLLGAVAAVALIAGALLAVGPEALFYRLHEAVFPPDHPWFFWYQDSLMSTLMQAPNLFGAIAALWALLALALGGAGLYGVRRLLGRQASP